ncbi:MAG: hypothetical protein KKD18_04395 [Nanoarchaeota archaeon]|nr:hypothetical protein [Nanoarchaeota archaeon]MBU0977630.1 hypothetical protein [Nanoarchaeota archaeon]
MADEREVIYHVTGRITSTGVELQRHVSRLPPEEVRELEAALRESFKGQVTSLRYSKAFYPIDVTIYARESPPNPPRQPDVDPSLYA